VNNWFHSVTGDTLSPAETIATISDEFLKSTKKFNLDIAVSESVFRKAMCEALCTFYHTYTYKMNWSGPNRNFPKPANWTEDIERAWNDYVNLRLFTAEFWMFFWRKIPEPMWEIPNWRENIQYLMPLYLRPSIDILIDKGLLMEQEDGEIVTAEDYESEEDPWFS